MIVDILTDHAVDADVEAFVVDPEPGTCYSPSLKKFAGPADLPADVAIPTRRMSGPLSRIRITTIDVEAPKEVLQRAIVLIREKPSGEMLGSTCIRPLVGGSTEYEPVAFTVAFAR